MNGSQLSNSTQSSLSNNLPCPSHFSPSHPTSGVRIFGKLHNKTRLGMDKKYTIFVFSIFRKSNYKYSRICNRYSEQVLGRSLSFSVKLLAHDTLPIPGSVVLPYGAPSFDPACTRESCRGYSRSFLLCCGSRTDRGPLGVSPFLLWCNLQIYLLKKIVDILVCQARIRAHPPPLFPPSFFICGCCC